MARNVTLQLLRGILANIPTLSVGELYLCTDTFQVYVGTSGGNKVISGIQEFQFVVDFGQLPKEDTVIQSTITGQSWVTSGTILAGNAVAGQDHTEDEVACEAPVVTFGNIVSGIGFDVVVSSPNGSSGKFLVNVMGK